MAKCGIERYDDLPARVRFIDVDMLRYRLKSVDEKLKHILKLKVKIQAKLETAHKLFNED